MEKNKIKKRKIWGKPFLKGYIPWNKGIKMWSEKQKKEMSGANNNAVNFLKGKTYEEIYGSLKKAKEIIEKKKTNYNMMNSATLNLKGKTYEEIYGPEKAKEQKEKRRLKIQYYYENGTAKFGFPRDGTMKIRRMSQIFPKEDTQIEKKIQMFLYDLKLEFYTHQYVHIEHGYQCDIFIPVQKGITQKIIIECDGDWWHGNIEIYSNLTEAQRCQKEEDYIRTKELKEMGFKVIRLWENEIKNMDLTIFKNKIGLPIGI